MIENQVFCGDNLGILETMLDNSVDLVYLDPPFFTQKTHTLKSRDLKNEYQFSDYWQDITDYLDFLRRRLRELHRVMKDTAMLFFHCDRTASHHIRILLDDVFGNKQFRSEIIWSYKRWSNAKRGLLNAHQTIYMYSKTDVYTFNQLLQDYAKTTNLDQILQRRERNKDGKTIYTRSDSGDVVLNGPKKGVPLSDVWDIPYLNPKAKERTGYPTQKPILLLERIIEIASNVDDIVLDPFCGSGTTLVAAKLSNRRYIGIDASQDAVTLTQKRLENPIKSFSNVMEKGESAYDNLPDDIKQHLMTLSVKFVQRNSGIDAIHDIFIDGRPIVIRIQRNDELLEETKAKLQKAGRKKDAYLMILIQTHDMRQETLFDTNIMLDDNMVILPSISFSLTKVISQFQQNHEIT